MDQPNRANWLSLVQSLVLELSRPLSGATAEFDASNYSSIDFRSIIDQWKSLTRDGDKLVIVFANGERIEIDNFFDDAVRAKGLIAQVADATLISAEHFFQWYGTAGSQTVGQAANPYVSSGAYFLGVGTSALPLLGNELGGFELSPLNPDGEINLAGPAWLADLSSASPNPAPPPPPVPPVPPDHAPQFLLSGPSANITEDSPPFVLTASVPFSDVDLADVHTVSITPNGPNYIGVWTGGIVRDSTGNGEGVATLAYAVDNAAIQYLAEGQTLAQEYQVVVDDGAGGTATTTASVIITGVNDNPVITGAIATGSVVEDELALMRATGTLDFSDVDLADAHVTSVIPQGGGYFGAFNAIINADSTGTGSGQATWLFLADNALRQALGAGTQVVQSYLVEIDDGHGGVTSQVVTITITGTNDAAIITGDTAGAVVEASGIANGMPGTPVATGNLDSSDVDNPADAWTVVATPTAGNNGYGAFTVNASGEWIYTVDNTNPDVEALNVGDTLTDTFTVATVDGTSQIVTITINGADDAPVISGDTSGSVTEASGIANGTPGIPTAAGNLDAADVDNADDLWIPVLTATAGDNGYGTFTVNASGEWTYTLDDSNAAVEALNVGDTLTDTFTVLTVDGTSQIVTITINGANDAPVISGDTLGSVTEASGIANGTPGIPVATGDLDASDVDHPADAWTAVATPAASGNGYGTFTVNASGQWIYTLDNSDAAVQALNVGGTLTDTLTVSTAAGDVQLITVTIIGENDAPVAAPVVLAPIVQDSGVRTISSAELLAGVSDIDGPSSSITSLSIASGQGTLTDNADGTWSYTPASGDSSEVIFNYTASDGMDTASSTASLDITPTTSGPPGLDLDGNDSNGGGFDYNSTFTMGGASISIGDVDVTITDPDSTTITSAHISMIANGQVPPNDILSINGILPAGIVASAYDATAGTMTLTGAASIADYEAALQQVVFSTVDALYNADRIVSVTVTDESNNISNVAQAFLHVTGSDNDDVGAHGTANWVSSDPAQQTAGTPGFPDGYPLHVSIPVSPLGNNVHVESAGVIPPGVFYFDGTNYVALTAGVVLYDPSLGINFLDDLVYRPTATVDDTVNVNLSLSVSDGVYQVSQNVSIYERPPSNLPSESVPIGDGGGPLNAGKEIVESFEISRLTVAGILFNPHSATIAVSTDFQQSPFNVPVPADERNPTTFDADNAGSQREGELQVELRIDGNSFVVVEDDLTAPTFEQSWFFDPVTGLMKATVDYDHIFLLDGSGNATATTLADYLIANPPSAGDTWTVVYHDNDSGNYQARQAQLDFSVDNPDDPSTFVFGDPTLVDRMNGTSGNDVLFGNGGDDIIIGRDGNDTLGGGADDDVLDGGADTDTATYVAATSGVTVDLTILTAQNTGGAGIDTLISIENIFGSTFADALTGDANANSLFGGAGDDTLTGGLGSDRLAGGAGADRFVYTSTADGGTFADQSGADRIASFDLAEGDSIDILASAFGGGLVAGTDATGIFGSSADDTFASSSERFHFNTASQALLYDSNGSDAGGIQSVLAVIANGNPVDATHIHMF